MKIPATENNNAMQPGSRQWFFFFMQLTAVLLLAGTGQCGSASAVGKGEILFQLDFTDAGGDGREWLTRKGFTLQRDMRENGSITLTGASRQGLLLETSRPAFGAAVREGISLPDAGILEVEWGVHRFPSGASWLMGVNREALQVVLFFGPKVQADRFFLPDSPLFIGHFLCENDPVNTPFIGRSYRDTGRFVCLGNPGEGTVTVSRFPFTAPFRDWFQREEVPPVTGLGIQMDTSGLDDGSASAFIRRITIYKKVQQQAALTP